MWINKKTITGWGDEEHTIGFQIGRLKVSTRLRSSKCLWGRFGGGWNYQIGIRAGGSTIIVYLLIYEITISWYKEQA